jgi:hypothetical protein
MGFYVLAKLDGALMNIEINFKKKPCSDQRHGTHGENEKCMQDVF